MGGDRIPAVWTPVGELRSTRTGEGTRDALAENNHLAQWDQDMELAVTDPDQESAGGIDTMQLRHLPFGIEQEYRSLAFKDLPSLALGGMTVWTLVSAAVLGDDHIVL